MYFSILTIFPDFFISPLQEGIVRKAVQENRVKIGVHNIRDFAVDRHRVTDDRPFGGGEGMVMKPEPLAACLRAVRQEKPSGRVILLSPKGTRFTQQEAARLTAYDHLLLVCGRYEGVDERFREKYVDEELSIGDYILTGGELAALVVLDAVCRLLPGVLGCEDSAAKDSFSRGLLKHGQYTRPRTFEGMSVPGVLLSGDHAAIEQFRFLESVKLTMERRPELLTGMNFFPDEEKLLQREGLRSRIDAIASDNREKSDTT
ncbi:MAG: tRNA (guanosine(37)-N1)-methyltransferase TrmD [Desulfobulbus sp.]|nr:tRNA (guanosine(37)-N1)-methyltransferase TrmD [Desulfobulbus sp.]